MIWRRHRDTFLFALLLTTRAAYVPSISHYEIQAYEFGGAFDTPMPRPPPTMFGGKTDRANIETDMLTQRKS